jgi:hypothetical protein
VVVNSRLDAAVAAGIPSTTTSAHFSSAAALAARLNATPTVLAPFAEVLELWAQLGNEALQWWVLGRLVGLLAALGADQDAAVLAGAVLAAADHRPLMPGETEQLETALRLIWPRLGTAATMTRSPQGRRGLGPGGVEYPVRSCDLHVLVQKAAERVSSQRPDGRAEGGGVRPAAGADRGIGVGGVCCGARGSPAALPRGGAVG